MPFYLLLVYLRLIDTWLGLILCYSTFNLAFVVVIMRDIFRDVSTEIEDAAKVEGATPWQIFWMIALPLSLDGLVVSSVLVFAFSWNEALFASALTSQAGRPLLRSRSRFAFDARRRFQHRRGQHADRHHPAGHLLFLRPALPRPRPVVRRCERIVDPGSQPIFTAAIGTEVRPFRSAIGRMARLRSNTRGAHKRSRTPAIR